MVVSIDDIHPPERVAGDAPRLIELAGLSAVAAPTAEVLAGEREFLHAMIAELAEVNDARFFVEMQIVRITKLTRLPAIRAPALRQLRLGAGDIKDLHAMVASIGDPQEPRAIELHFLRSEKLAEFAAVAAPLQLELA